MVESWYFILQGKQKLVCDLGSFGNWGWNYKVRSFATIRKRISDPKTFGSWYNQGTGKSTLSEDSLIPLMCHNRSDLGSLILFLIIPKERTCNVQLSKRKDFSYETLVGFEKWSVEELRFRCIVRFESWTNSFGIVHFVLLVCRWLSDFFSCLWH